MQTVVLVKQVVDTEAEKRLLSGEWRLDRATVENILNPYDEYAVEAAVQLKEELGGEVTVLSMGPQEAEEAIRKALAMGADRGVLVSDPVLQGSDALATASVLAQVLRGLGFDLVLCGSMSTDAQTGLVPAALGELLDLPVLGAVNRLEVHGGSLKAARQTDEGAIVYECPLPVVVAVAKGINEPRYPSLRGIMGAKKKPLDTKTAANLTLELGAVGLGGARTRVHAAAPVPPRASGKTVTEYESPQEGAGLLADFLHENKLV